MGHEGGDGGIEQEDRRDQGQNAPAEKGEIKPARLRDNAMSPVVIDDPLFRALIDLARPGLSSLIYRSDIPLGRDRGAAATAPLKS